ncbi:AT-rich interactive domain-containing protein [Quillaja saponaria]|uniref:AT-rich interactive domain-containing protein n=1 Tax=Quillaja saponaria TaxID=32244 RepID=A0AAD7KSI0_QUISA|nr:AT-rich interactive domain-containing protein [Quillaja saponaria]
MAGWSTLINGSGLDCVENVGAFQGNGYCLTLDNLENGGIHDSNDFEVKQKRLFYNVVSVYLEQSSSRGLVRPLPVMLGDGQQLDLYKLFCSVKERGGYSLVSENGLWATVVEELGLDVEFLASVKLIFDKYLNELEGWFWKNYVGEKGCDDSSKFLPFELEKEFRDLLSVGPKSKQKREGHVNLESNRMRKYMDVGIQENISNFLDTKNEHLICEDVQNTHIDDDEKVFKDDENDALILDSRVDKKEFDQRKRKREVLSGMLNWVRLIAEHPLDPSFGLIDPSKWKEYEGQEFWGQALRAREALLMKRQVKSHSEPSPSQKLKMHPAMYEDDLVHTHQSTGKLRSSERLPPFSKSHLGSGCNSCSASTSKLPSSINIKADSSPMEQPPEMVNLLAVNPLVNPSDDDPTEKQVSVGPFHQAEVPIWTGVVSESNSKWLGTQIWPLKDRERNSMIEGDPIGKGRQEACNCQFQGSVECVRFHVAESRMKLKLELGSAFYYWRFDCMGEEVSLKWTTEEEKRFKDMMRSNSPLNGSFRDNLLKYFPRKTKRDLVSYYFNAFLIQLRSYQNRVTPKSIDSDSDESEFGSFSDGFGHEAIRVPDFDFLECYENKQCTDLE